MIRKMILWLFVILAGGCCFIWWFKINTDKKITITKNGFSRRIIDSFLTVNSHAPLRYNSYYLAGLSFSRIYLGNYKNPADLIVADYSGNLQYRELHVPDTARIAWSASKVYIDSPDIYLAEGVSPQLLYGNVSDLQLKEISHFDYIHFNGILPVNKDLFFLENYNRVSSSRQLSKKHFRSNDSNDPILQLKKQREGNFSEDGLLFYNRDPCVILYMFFYRNQVLCLDSDLNSKGGVQTIDTNSIAKISIDTVHSEHMATFSSPPLIVNHSGCADSGYLYIRSDLKADNENTDTFNDNDVIDVYNIKRKLYLFSFYIPHWKGIAQTSFRVSGRKLVVIFKNNLVVYSMRQGF